MITVAVTKSVRNTNRGKQTWRNILLIGANQMKMRCNHFVVIELITPRNIRSAMDKRTVSQAVLQSVSSRKPDIFVTNIRCIRVPAIDELGVHTSSSK